MRVLAMAITATMAGTVLALSYQGSVTAAAEPLGPVAVSAAGEMTPAQKAGSCKKGKKKHCKKRKKKHNCACKQGPRGPQGPPGPGWGENPYPGHHGHGHHGPHNHHTCGRHGHHSTSEHGSSEIGGEERTSLTPQRSDDESWTWEETLEEESSSQRTDSATESFGWIAWDAEYDWSEEFPSWLYDHSAGSTTGSQTESRVGQIRFYQLPEVKETTSAAERGRPAYGQPTN